MAWEPSSPHRGEVLVVSPHPDDESIGAPVTLSRLKNLGYKVTNLAISLGKPADHKRRRRELGVACERAGVNLLIAKQTIGISGSDDLEQAQRQINEEVAAALEDLQPAVVVAPSVWDNHHGHEVVARGTRDALEQSGPGARLMMYELWGMTPPNLYVPFGENDLHDAIYTLEAYKGENTRNDYRDMVRGRAILNRPRGAEMVLGFGASSGSLAPYAELLTDSIYTANGWRQVEPRIFSVEDALPTTLSPVSLHQWMHSPSPYQQLREQR